MKGNHAAFIIQRLRLISLCIFPSPIKENEIYSPLNPHFLRLLSHQFSTFPLLSFLIIDSLSFLFFISAVPVLHP